MNIIITESHLKKLYEAYDEKLINSYLDRYDTLTDEEKEELIKLSRGEDIAKQSENNKTEYYDNNLDDDDTVDYDDLDDYNEKAEMFLNFFKAKKRLKYPINNTIWVINYIDSSTGGYLTLENENNIIYVDPFKNNDNKLDFIYENDLISFMVKRDVTTEESMKDFIGVFIKKIIPETINKFGL